MSASSTDPLDHFSLFGLEPRFAIDEAELEGAFRDLQSRVHPDRFAGASAPERRVAMQWAARANEAYATLRNPLRRAAYLCERRGAKIEAESNTSMPVEFLMQQMEWRESLAESSGDAQALGRLIREVEARRQDLITGLTQALDQNPDAERGALAASALVRQLMFVDKFGSELAAAIENH